MKTLEFKVWQYFIPTYGLFYFLWYTWVTLHIEKYKTDIHKLYKWHPLAYVGFIFYNFVHVWGFAFLVAWILTFFGVI